METVWIVIIDKCKKLLKYDERYLVFSEGKKQEAFEYAQSCGYLDPFNMGINEKIGILNFYDDGNNKVGIMHVEVDK